MKTSRTNSHSFRLHHIGRPNSTRKTSQTFYNPDDSFKLAALNSVTRSIKNADLTFMTGTNLQKLRVEPLEINEGMYHSAHQNLTEVRVRYDEVRKLCVQLEKKIDGMKEQKAKFVISQQQYDKKTNQAKNKAGGLAAKLQEKKSLLEQTATETKVLHNMEWRHKTDKIFYDQRKYDLLKELQYKHKQLTIFNREGIENHQSEDRTSKIYQKLAAQLERERLQREQHIKNLQLLIQQKFQLQNRNSEREADLIEIAERAIQDKDYNQKQWRQIFLTHTFVNKMLRNKIEKEMETFRTVEFAFKEIKTATGVTDARTLVNKYLNKQTVYGQLLSKIADNQKTIQQLKNQTEQLIQESKQLQMEKEVLQSVKIKSQDLHDPLKDLQTTENKATRAENYTQKMTLWTSRQLKKFNDKKPQEESNLTPYITKFLNILTTEVDTATAPHLHHREQADFFTQRENERNARILPRKSRRNSIGEQIFDVDQEEANPNSNIEEQEHINNQNEYVLRQNEKFMKEVKKRKEEEKKLLLEKKDPKPKEGPKIVELKKEQQD